MNKPKLNDKWIKASVIGTIWAASEIVFGSFLHNLKIPFSGNILTAIGIIVLISAAFIWDVKGVFWRAGLICALMKTMSPSAVIFGPMLAILIEAILLELSIRIFGKTYLGFIIGAILAMSWNLVQKVLSYILFYGADIIKIYSGLITIAEKQIKVHFDLVWVPILVLLCAYAIFGIIAAITGIKAGKFIAKKSLEPQKIHSQDKTIIKKKQEKFNHSILWLSINICFMISGLLILKYTDWYFWTSTIVVFATIWIIRYRRALRKISNPKFWIIFVLITMITVFVFSRVKGGENYLIDGIIAGVQMNFRAILMVLGFAVIAVELYNPAIRSFFRQSSFRQLPVALELATDSLPTFIAALPDFKTAVKNPTTIFYSVILHADARIKELSFIQNNKPHIYIISGKKNEGKTTLVKSLAKDLKNNSKTIGGIFSEKHIQNDKCIGYDIVDVNTGNRAQFLIEGNIPNCQKIMKFSIINDVLVFGNSTIKSAISEKEIIIIDEIGLLELENGGWHKSLLKINQSKNKTFIITIRDIYVEDIIEKYNLADFYIITLNDKNSAKDILQKIVFLSN
jgi:nucleoside-triphosphatase THEP1